MKIVISLILIGFIHYSMGQVQKMERRVDTTKPILLEKNKLVDTGYKKQVSPYKTRMYDDTIPKRTVFKVNTIRKTIVETRIFNGQIKDANNNPVPGATIKIKGKNTAVTTDANGNFSISIDKQDHLSVSIVGFTNIELNPNQNNITIDGLNIQSSQQIFNSEQITTQETNLNVFPVPYPIPSATFTLRSSSIAQCQFFYQVDSILTEGLDRCQYDEKRHYFIPHGFALVTQMEQIDQNGISLDQNRWDYKIASELNDPWDYIKALFSSPKGYYRVFVFLFTDIDLSSGNNPIAEEEARKWLDHGIIGLPNEIKYAPVTNNYHCTLLVYHYEKKPGSTGRMLSPSLLTGRNHFIYSHLSNFIR